jgi:hypothetical protein
MAMRPFLDVRHVVATLGIVHTTVSQKDAGPLLIPDTP